MYDTQDKPYGSLNRYAAHLRVTDDLATCPSGDDFKSYVVWAGDPYQAHSVAIFTATQIEGRQLRFFIGVAELPHRPDPEGKHDD